MQHSKSSPHDLKSFDTFTKNISSGTKDPPLRQVDPIDDRATNTEKSNETPKKCDIRADQLDHPESSIISEAPGLVLTLDDDLRIQDHKQQQTKKIRFKKIKRAKKDNESSDVSNKKSPTKRKRKTTKSKSPNKSKPINENQMANSQSPLNLPESDNQQNVKQLSIEFQKTQNQMNYQNTSIQNHENQKLPIPEHKTPNSPGLQLNMKNTCETIDILVGQVINDEPITNAIERYELQKQQLNKQQQKCLFKPPSAVKDDSADNYVQISDKIMAVGFQINSEKSNLDQKAPITSWKPFQISPIPDPDDTDIESSASYSYDFLHMINEMKNS